MNRDTFDDLSPFIRDAAVHTAGKCPGVAEADDIEQEIWGRLLESDGYLADLLGMAETNRKRALHAIGSQITGEFRADYERFTAQIFYSTDDVRGILKRGCLTEHRTKTDTERVDLDEGITAVRDQNARYAEILWSEYVTDDLDKSDTSTRKALQRSVDSLTYWMNAVHKARENRQHEGPGSRKALTNARSRELD